MQLSFSDDSGSCCDLLCNEEAETLLAGETPDRRRETDFPEDSDESIQEFIEGESGYSPAVDYPARFRSSSLDPTARKQSVSWILKVQEHYQFQPLTAYLAVNYMDRFLSSHILPQVNGWPLQLLTVACLSLAAKMEETLVPSLLDLQVEDARFIFESRTVHRMELLVLTALNWRLRSVTPFTFIDFFAHKLDSAGIYTRHLVSRATKIILAAIKDIDFLDHCPSSMAAAATLCAASESQELALINPGVAEEWCIGLTTERISSCCRLMQPKAVSHWLPNKRRRLNNYPGVGEDKQKSSDTDLSSTIGDGGSSR